MVSALPIRRYVGNLAPIPAAYTPPPKPSDSPAADESAMPQSSGPVAAAETKTTRGSRSAFREA